MPIGLHLHKSEPFDAGIRHFAEYLETFGIANGCVQLFIRGPLNHNINIPQSDRSAIKKASEETSIQIIAHASYMSQPWSKGLAMLLGEMEIALAIGARGINLHMGKKMTLESVLNMFQHIYEKDLQSLPVYFETEAQANSEHVNTKFMISLYNAVMQSYPTAKFGFCIDTAHVWASGIAVDTSSACQEYLAPLLAHHIPLMFHLNDDENEMSSGKDIHQPIGTGTIWNLMKFSQTGAYYILGIAFANDFPVILERHKNTSDAEFELIASHKLA